jgi:organic radical activating enzyme
MKAGKKSIGGFRCDTEFTSGIGMSADRVLENIGKAHEGASAKWVVLTGGEPLLQVDAELIKKLKKAGYLIAIETNGTQAIPEGLDWVCVSPKVAEHCLVSKIADEVKYVRNIGQGIPKPAIKATHQYISPAFNERQLDSEVLAWCIKLVKENPAWTLSVQDHNLWSVR